MSAADPLAQARKVLEELYALIDKQKVAIETYKVQNRLERLRKQAEILQAGTLPPPITPGAAASGSYPPEVFFKVISAYDNAPVAGAVVALGTGSRLTDASGVATFLGIPSGSYLLVVSAAGYVVHTRTVQITVTSYEFTISLVRRTTATLSTPAFGFPSVPPLPVGGLAREVFPSPSFGDTTAAPTGFEPTTTGAATTTAPGAPAMTAATTPGGPYQIVLSRALTDAWTRLLGMDPNLTLARGVLQGEDAWNSFTIARYNASHPGDELPADLTKYTRFTGEHGSTARGWAVGAPVVVVDTTSLGQPILGAPGASRFGSVDWNPHIYYYRDPDGFAGMDAHGNEQYGSSMKRGFYADLLALSLGLMP